MVRLRRGPIAAIVAVSIVSGLPPLALDAQSVAVPPAVRLGPATGSLSEEFVRIASVRELPDRRVLVSDEQATRVVVADFAVDRVTPIGRTGRGPGEYQQVGRIWPLTGDSTLVKEPYAPKWVVLRGAEIVATLGMGERAVAAVGMMGLNGSDTLGGLFVMQFGRDRMGRPSMSDSMVVVRVDRRSLRTDTIARLRSVDDWSRSAGVAPSPPAVAAGGSGRAPRRYSVALQAHDQFAVFADGWVAVARVDPYRVDWCPPRRPCRAGPVLAAARLAMTARIKQVYLDIARRTHTWPPTTDIDATFGWPAIVPPFVSPAATLDGTALWAMPDGRLLIQRFPAVDAELVRYDIVRRDGVVAAQLLLPVGERVVGLGARSLYVAVTDDDGIQRLRRHAWP